MLICNKSHGLGDWSGNRIDIYPDSKVHGANMGPIWGRQDPGGPHVGPMNFAICVGSGSYFPNECHQNAMVQVWLDISHILYPLQKHKLD